MAHSLDLSCFHKKSASQGSKSGLTDLSVRTVNAIAILRRFKCSNGQISSDMSLEKYYNPVRANLLL